MVAAPLMAAGHMVRVYLAFDRGCEDDYAALAREVWPYGPVAATEVVNATSQPDGVRAALGLYFARAALQPSDYLLLLRWDLTLRLPIGRWTIDPYRLALASVCEDWAWKVYNCSNDVAFFVPRRMLPAFNASVGANDDAALVAAHQAAGQKVPWMDRARRCCFNEQCLGGGGGHGCLNVLAARLGHAALTFAFGPPQKSRWAGQGTVLFHSAYSLVSCRHIVGRERMPAHRTCPPCCPAGGGGGGAGGGGNPNRSTVSVRASQVRGLSVE